MFIALSCLAVADLLILSKGTSGWLLTAAGILATACLLSEWNVIIRFLRIQSESLATIERLKPRIPKKLEVLATNALTVLLLVLSVQFVGIVYAMSFTLFATTTETKSSYDAVMFDVDGDGDQDWIAGTNDGAGDINHDLYLNDGSGNFTLSPSTFGESTSFNKFIAADIDGDGDMDLIANNASTGIYRYVNNGSGVFSAYSFANSTASAGLVGGDFNGDGSVDFILYDLRNETSLEPKMYLNDGHGNFTLTTSPLPVALSMTAADFDSDGALDLALSSADVSRIYRNSGTGAFVSIGTFSASAPANGIVPSDVDGDGDIDLIAHGGTTYSVYLNNGTGTSWSAGATATLAVDAPSAYPVGIGDLDNDGDLDFMVPGCDGVGVTGGTDIYFNNGAGTAYTHPNDPAEDTDCVSAVAIGDIDADGDLDYVRAVSAENGTDRNNRVYKSDQAATSANTAPTAPSTDFVETVVSPSPKDGVTFANDASIGTDAWIGAGNAQTSDNSYADVDINGPGQSNYLKATNFRFNVPTNATITGIGVDVERNGGFSVISDYAVRIVKGGTIGSTDKSSATIWGGTDSTASYGGSTDLWGETWTASDINATTFGFAIAAQNSMADVVAANIDHIRITVYYNMRDIRLSWGSGSDTETATKLLQYQLRVGTGSSANNIISGVTGSPNWVSRVMPNGQSRTYILKNLTCGNTYYWSAAAVDTGFRKTWGSQQTFTLNASCAIAAETTTTDVGGGLPWNVLRQVKEEIEEAPKTGTLTVTTFNDVNGDGVQQKNEAAGFGGLPVTASGMTIDGTASLTTLPLSEAGTASFELLASVGSGYTISVDTGSLALQGYEPTTATSSGGYVIKAGSKLQASFGFRRTELLTYSPCLSVNSPEGVAPSPSEASSLLIRLEDGFGQKTMRAMTFSGTLVTRDNFLTLLQRTQCIPLLTTQAAMIEGLRDKEDVSWPLIDLPMNLHSPDAITTYSLLAAGIRADRKTANGAAADLSSPVTRQEAMQMVFDALDIPPEKQVASGAKLPVDLELRDPLVPVFLTLESLGVLPESFLQVLGPNLGMNPDELSLLMVRAAFRAGKISLLAEMPDPSARQKLKGAAPEETFLAELPPLEPLTCLERHPERAESLSFSDVLPGDPLFVDVRELVTRGMPNPDGKMLWLLPATGRPTEYGVTKGKGMAGLGEPVGMLETLRDLLVLSCLPQETAKDVASGKSGKIKEGSAESKVPRDRITDLERDTSFASRVLYRAQDHELEFDLSLFMYAPELLRLPPRSPTDPLSLEEAASLLSSSLLRIAVKQAVLTPQEAEGKAGDVRAAIARDFLGQDIDWRSEAVLKQTVFTREMLLKFLATVAFNRTSSADSSDTASIPVSLGEIWWERVR